MWRHGIYVIWTLFERVQSTILGDADANCNYKFAVSCFIFSRISLFCGYAGLDSKGSNRGSVSNGSHGNHSPDAPPPLDPSITYINAGEEDQMVGSCCAVWWRFSHFHIPSRICFPSDWPLLTRQSALVRFILIFLFFLFFFLLVNDRKFTDTVDRWWNPLWHTWSSWWRLAYCAWSIIGFRNGSSTALTQRARWSRRKKCWSS